MNIKECSTTKFESENSYLLERNQCMICASGKLFVIQKTHKNLKYFIS